MSTPNHTRIIPVAALAAAVALPLAGCAGSGTSGTSAGSTAAVAQTTGSGAAGADAGDPLADKPVAAETRAASQGQLADTKLGAMFQGLPKPKDAALDGTATVTPQEVTQSYTLKGTTPGAVLRWYDHNLSDWQLEGDSLPSGTDTAEGTWDQSHYVLTVSAQRTGPEAVELSLQLDDRDARP